MAEILKIYDAFGDGKKFYKTVTISATGQLIGVDQSDVSTVLADVDTVADIATNAASNLTKVPATAATVADTTFVTGGIIFPIKASEVLWIEGDIMISSAAAGTTDMDFKFIVPASATATGSITVGGAELYAEADLTSAVTVNCAATGTLTAVHVMGLITNSTTAGTVDLQFAHNTGATDVMTFRTTSVLNAAVVS